MKKVLLTGFGPFGKDTVNPALITIQELSGKRLNAKKGKKQIEYEIISKEIPVVYGKAIEEFIASVNEVKPDLIISIGQAGGRPAISLERVGINVDDADIPDNEKQKLRDSPIIKNGPAAYFTTMDIRNTFNKIQKAGIPVIISNSAGTYVCNNLTYGALHFLATTPEYSHIKYLFIHIPFIPSQVAEKKQAHASMSLDLIKEAIKIAIEVNLD